MLTSLRLQNFKSWADTGQLRLAPITGLFGTNSSGKSSILQFLLMLKQTAEAADRGIVLELGDERSLADVGAFEDLVHGRCVERPLRFGLEWEPTDEVSSQIRRATGLRPTDVIGLCARVSQDEQGSLICEGTRYSLGSATTGWRLRRVAAIALDELPDVPAQPTYRDPEAVDSAPQAAKFYIVPERPGQGGVSAAASDALAHATETALETVLYLGPLREFPKRYYAWRGSTPSDLGARGERVVEALLSAEATGGQVRLPGLDIDGPDPQLTETIAGWLVKLGLVDGVEIEPVTAGPRLYRVSVRTTPNGPPVALPDVGFGVSQLLPVLVLCYYAPKGSTLLIEQPELHLHPAAQMGLADVFVHAIRKRDIQIILESHSEHLLRRLQRRIAEGALEPDDTALYFCRKEDDHSAIDELQLDDDGNIVNWPEDFFGDQFGEIAAMTHAVRDRHGRPES